MTELIDLTEREPRPWAGRLAAVAAWTAVVIVYGLILHLQIHLPLAMSIEQSALEFYLLALLLIPVGRWSAIWMARRHTPLALIAGHAIAGLLVIAIWQGALMLYYRLSIGPLFWNFVYAQSWMFMLLSAVTTYGMALGVTLVSQAWRRERARERREAALIVAARDAELASIKAQFQPHFVLNALTSLLALIDDDPALARTMVVRLADLMKSVFERADVPNVPLERELELARAYLDVERIRLGDRLTVVFDIDDAARAVMVPPFLLQPLVENGVKHGIAPFAKAGILRVEARSRGQRMHLSINDTGNGSSTIEVAGRGVSAVEGTGRGLTLTRRRLETLYGNQFTLTISHRDEGTSVELDLPAHAA